MDVFTNEDALILNKVKFFTARPDTKGRLQVPAQIRNQLQFRRKAFVMLGFERGNDLLFLKRKLDCKGRVYVSALNLDNCLVSVEKIMDGGKENVKRECDIQ